MARVSVRLRVMVGLELGLGLGLVLETLFPGQPLIDRKDQMTHKIQLVVFPPLAGLSVSELSRPRRMMLLVNPQSGKGQALTMYNNCIQRLLNEAGVPHTLVITGESTYQSRPVQQLSFALPRS